MVQTSYRDLHFKISNLCPFILLRSYWFMGKQWQISDARRWAMNTLMSEWLMSECIAKHCQSSIWEHSGWKQKHWRVYSLICNVCMCIFRKIQVTLTKKIFTLTGTLGLTGTTQFTTQRSSKNHHHKNLISVFFNDILLTVCSVAALWFMLHPCIKFCNLNVCS